jgi:hypothetical protein
MGRNPMPDRSESDDDDGGSSGDRASYNTAESKGHDAGRKPHDAKPQVDWPR